ncbi:Vesicle membrane receptor protein (v-SNARE) [Basidiobolus ranarum]|uniref:Vesicle membrane receptor protein (V-SNARE) n=1 Tax=Basidiobolus ranarum TaxID=34480 RepID=A0ABR2WW41_9FUNG
MWRQLVLRRKMSSDAKASITSAPNPIPDDRSTKVQQQVNHVVDIMRDNIGKVMDRGEKLENLSHQASDLEMESNRFRQNPCQVRKHMWCGNMKMRFAIAAIIVGIIVCIIATIVLKTKDSQSTKPTLTQSA